MKTIGLVGGTSWVSTVDYYRLLNENINQRLGGSNFARCILYSFNFADIEQITRRQDWGALLNIVTPACKNLTASGAEGIMLCANTLHVIADDIRAKIDVPLIHIAEATGAVIVRQKLKKVGLLGTKFTMEMDFSRANSPHAGLRLSSHPRPTANLSTCQYLTNWEKGYFSRAHGSATSRSSESSQQREPRESSSAAPRYRCSSSKRTLPFRSSTP